MNRFVRTIVAAAGLLALTAPATGSADGDGNDARLRTDLSGFNEVIGPSLAADLVRTFLRARFDGGERYVERLRKVEAMERQMSNG